jgi:hypothetical protein
MHAHRGAAAGSPGELEDLLEDLERPSPVQALPVHLNRAPPPMR